MQGYVFLSNSTKPTEKQQNSREPIILTNVSKPCLKTALDMGYEVYLGVNRANPDELNCELPIKKYDSHTYRSISALKDNKIAFANLSEVIKNGNIEVIHCNTPVGGLIGRLAGKKYHIKKVIYTAHGFHFYKGAPLFNRTVLKWAEMIMAHWTDVIITLNEEDFEAAKKFKLKKGGKVYKVHGVGIDTNQYLSDGKLRDEKRAELNIPLDAFVVISVGELNENKNNKVIISALEKLKNKNIHYILCGVGDKKDELSEMAQSAGISENVHFLGYRTDIKALYNASDCFVMPSYREGLSRSAMEAMASGLPCILSDIRGNRDLIENGSGGILCKPDDASGFSEAISKLFGNSLLCEKMKEYNLKKIKDFDTSFVEKEIREIYSEVLGVNVNENIALAAKQ